MLKSDRHLAILGAGPIGLELALQARSLGYSVSLYERGEVAENLRRWEHLRLFTPWRLNTSRVGLEVLRSRGLGLPDPENFPTAGELRDRYLVPLASAVGPTVRVRTLVRGVARTGLLKPESPGGKRRGRAPFRILLEDPDAGEVEALADIVVDCTGVYGTPARLGDGGLDARGESACADRIDYHLLDLTGRDFPRVAGKHVLLVGAGFSAATSLAQLAEVAARSPGTRVTWARRSTGPDPFPVIDGDPLPERSRLAREGNRLATRPPGWLTTADGVAVAALERAGSGLLEVKLRPVDGGGVAETIRVDHVLANVGYRPDLDLARELQVHYCYASEGPMALAAALLARGGGGDCLTQKSCGPDTLRTPEPGFFILGHKSYGRRSDFLLRVGREQVRDLLRILEDDPDLDLEARAELDAKRGGLDGR